MLGDTAVAVNSNDPRYTHLRNKFIVKSNSNLRSIHLMEAKYLLFVMMY